MKTKLCALFSVLIFFCTAAYAQQARNGIPWSKMQPVKFVPSSAEVVLPHPDFAAAATGDRLPSASAGAYRIALPVETNLSVQKDGTITYLNDGRMIWQLSLTIPDAKAISTEIDNLYLPEGVRLYFRNNNGKQLIGAFANKDNSSRFGVPMIQGATMHLELNIPPGIALSDISLNIHKAYAAYRSGLVADLEQYYGSAVSSSHILQRPLNDLSSPCQINAVCETDSLLSKIKNTTAMIILDGYMCSGNLVNTGQNDCTPYLLTASHCEVNNSVNSSTFSSWVFYFNYEYPNCADNSDNSVAPLDQFLTGAEFVTRSFIQQTPNPQVIGDFLLLKLNDPYNFLSNDWDAYLAGWSIEDASSGGTSLPDTLYNLINFHHPAGDPKKVSSFGYIESGYNFNGTAEDSHWKALYTSGTLEGGSSGSGIFTASDGFLRGMLSGGPYSPSCEFGEYNYALFSKLSRCWEYPDGDGTPQMRLRDHLDPNGLGLTHAPTVKYICAPVSLESFEEDPDVYIFPNPASETITIKTNLLHKSDIALDIYDIEGRKRASYQLSQMSNGEVSMDISQLSNGLYLVKIKAGNATWSQKLVVNHR